MFMYVGKLGTVAHTSSIYLQRFLTKEGYHQQEQQEIHSVRGYLVTYILLLCHIDVERNSDDLR